MGGTPSQFLYARVRGRKLLQISFFSAPHMDLFLSDGWCQWLFLLQSEGFLALQVKRGSYFRKRVLLTKRTVSANVLFRAPLVLNCKNSCTPELQLFLQFRTILG